LWLDSGELEARQMIVEGWEAKHAQLHAEFDGVLAHIRQKTSARLETMMSKKGFKSFLTKAIVYDLI
jgi:putative heme iron utilization protein